MWAMVLWLALLAAIIWVASTALPIIFTGILIGVALDAGAYGLQDCLAGVAGPHSRSVILVVSALVISALAWGGMMLIT